MKYAVEVAKLGSLNKAAGTLLIAQPNISRSIKELEADLGITIFNRTSKGMELTPDGEEFILHAKEILKEIDKMESLYKQGPSKKQKFSISAPSDCYIAEAFAEFSAYAAKEPAELIYREDDSRGTIRSIISEECRLGIIRYADIHDRYFKDLLEEKGLTYEVVAEFSPLILTSVDSPLSRKETVGTADLESLTEIAQVTRSDTKLSDSEQSERRILVPDRATLLEVLSENPETYARTSPASDKTLKRHGLTVRICSDGKRVYKDLLIYKDGYRLSRMDKLFITALCNSKRRHGIS